VSCERAIAVIQQVLGGWIIMKIVPHSILGRVFCVLWLAACAALLVYAFSQRNVHEPDIGITFTLTMITLTFPIGYVLAALAGYIFLFLYKSLGIVNPGSFWADAIAWIVFVVVGYFQWFVFIPWLYRKAKQHRTQS
jgi:hypothetical protein